jgi:GTP cyclohydrolase II
MTIINDSGEGVIVYLKQEGRGIGLLEKMKAYNLQDQGHGILSYYLTQDTVTANLMLSHKADHRSYEAACAILNDLGVGRVKLLTNNPDKIERLEEGGIEVAERIAMVPKCWEGDGKEGKVEEKDEEVDNYLRVKIAKMNHML